MKLSPARSRMRVHASHRPLAPHVPQRDGVARRGGGEERVGLRRQLYTSVVEKVDPTGCVILFSDFLCSRNLGHSFLTIPALPGAA